MEIDARRLSLQDKGEMKFKLSWNIKFIPVIQRSFLYLCTLLALIPLGGCKPQSRERAFGYLRLGLLRAFPADEEYLKPMRLYLRHDAKGYSIMSTECTYDLSPLSLENREGVAEFRSTISESRYSLSGAVLHGPAVKPLPFYRLEINVDPGSSEQVLYVRIGDAVPAEWRLTVPN